MPPAICSCPDTNDANTTAISIPTPAEMAHNAIDPGPTTSATGPTETKTNAGTPATIASAIGIRTVCALSSTVHLASHVADQAFCLKSSDTDRTRSGPDTSLAMTLGIARASDASVTGRSAVV